MFITHDSWFFHNILIQSIKLSQKPYFLRAAMSKVWFIELKAFSKSIVIKYRLNFSISHTSLISEARRPLSPINPLSTWMVWPGLIKTGSKNFYRVSFKYSFLIQVKQKDWARVRNISFIWCLEKCPRGKSPLEKSPPEIYPQENFSREKCCPEKSITSRKIVLLDFCCFWQDLTVVPFKIFYSN